MEKNLSALGFMSGTSGDGVDSSVIDSNGEDIINIKYNRFDPYPTSLSNKIHRIKESILKMQDFPQKRSFFYNLEIVFFVGNHFFHLLAYILINLFLQICSYGP